MTQEEKWEIYVEAASRILLGEAVDAFFEEPEVVFQEEPIVSAPTKSGKKIGRPRKSKNEFAL